MLNMEDILNPQIASSQEVFDKYGITEYTVADINRLFEDAMTHKQERARLFKVLDAADKSEIWKTFNRSIPSYVQTPVANPITVIKEATKASVMPTSYAAEFRPLTMEAKDLANRANRFFEQKWQVSGLDRVNSTCGNYGALHGTSGVLFGWNADIVDSSDFGSNIFEKQTPLQVKAFHPQNIFPDPASTTIQEADFIAFAERKSRSFLARIPRFRPSLERIKYLNDSLGDVSPSIILDASRKSMSEVVTFVTMYKRVNRMKPDMYGTMTMQPSVDIIYLAGKDVLDVSKDIKPATLPFVPFYDEQMDDDFWGTSRCIKVLSLVVALNQLDSTEATAYFRNQNPSEFINALAGLNITEYQKQRGNPDKAFTVNIDPRIVQSYATVPDIPKNIDTFRQYLIRQIQNISGVDAAYLGQSYGSIQTTGGVSQALERSTMRDSNRIKEIDKFIRDEVTMMAQFYIHHGGQEKFFNSPNRIAHEQEGQEITFDPAELVGRSDISVEVSNSAPRSYASYEEAALKLFELQMKYSPGEKGYPDLITPEELVGWLNIPKSQKNVLMDRMKIQMENMKLEEYMAVLTSVGTLVQGGLPPEQALQEVVTQMEQALGQLPAANPAPGSNMPR